MVVTVTLMTPEISVSHLSRHETPIQKYDIAAKTLENAICSCQQTAPDLLSTHSLFTCVYVHITAKQTSMCMVNNPFCCIDCTTGTERYISKGPWVIEGVGTRKEYLKVFVDVYFLYT